MSFSFLHCSFFKVFNDMMINAVLAKMNIKSAIWKMMLFSNSILMMRITFFLFFNSKWKVLICWILDISWNRFSIVWCTYSSEIDLHDLIIISHFSVDCFNLAHFLNHQKERLNQIFITQHDTSSTKFNQWYDHEISDNKNKKSKLAYSWSRCSTTWIIARSWLNDATMQLINLTEFYWNLN